METSSTTNIAALVSPLAIDHVGVAVPDLDSALDWYTRVLGGTVAHREVNEEQQVVEAMVRFGDGGTELQLLAPLSPDSAIGKFLDQRGPGLQQLAFRVADVRAAATALTGAGLRMLYPEPRRGTHGSAINFIHPRDAGGVLIELVQPAG